MNASTTQYIYHNYQKEQYYNQYLKQLNHRVDGRKVQAHRDIKVSISHNSVVVSRGQTVIIAQLQTSLQQVAFSPVSQSFGKQLINVSIKEGSNSKIQRNAEKSLQSFVGSFIDWRHIQQQIFEEDLNKKQTLAHCGELVIRVTSDDGCLEETCLLGAFFLLWTCSFKMKDSVVYLKLEDFYVPFKYCDILGNILVDPSSEEELDSNYEVTIIENITNIKQPLIVRRHLHSGTMEEATIEALKKLQKTQVEKLPLNIKQIQQKMKETNNKTISLILSSI